MTREDVRHVAQICAERYRSADSSVDLGHVCRGEGVRLFSYGAAREHFGRFGIADVLDQSGGAFAHGWSIFFDETLSEDVKRANVARELGRILLNAVDGEGAERAAADMELFAEVLLTPPSCTAERSELNKER